MVDAALRQLVREEVGQALREALAPVLALLQHRDEDSGWTTRVLLAKQRGCSLDTVDRESFRSGGTIERRSIGRRVQVRERPRLDENEIVAAAAAAR